MNSVVKKVLLVLLLVAVIAVVVIIAVNASQGKREVTQTEASVQRTDESGNAVNTTNITETQGTAVKLGNKQVEISSLEDGTLYQIKDEQVEPEIVIKDNLFDTQVTDMTINFEQYEGKTVSIEGLFFTNAGYTFVGRYSTNSMCPTCPAGISYYEYEWHGDTPMELKNEDSWIKVTGTLKKGNDGMEYVYIDASSVEIMNEKGLTTVNN